MTPAELKRIVRIWMKRLRLTHWRIKFVFETELQNDYLAEIHRASYDYATLKFSAKHTTWDEFEANQIVVHELMHLLTRDLHAAGDEVTVLLPDSAKALHEQRFEHELEGVVDRLGTLFVELCGVA